MRVQFAKRKGHLSLGFHYWCNEARARLAFLAAFSGFAFPANLTREMQSEGIPLFHRLLIISYPRLSRAF